MKQLLIIRYYIKENVTFYLHPGSSPSRLATNRTTETADERIAPVPESPKQKVHHDYMITTRSIGRSIETDTLLVTFFCPAPSFNERHVILYVVSLS